MKKQLNKCLVSILTLAIITTSLPVNLLTAHATEGQEPLSIAASVSDAEPEGSDLTGTFGDNNGFSWNYDEGTATLTVTGEDSGLNTLRHKVPDTVMENVKNIIFQDCVVSGSLNTLLYENDNVENVEFHNVNTSNVTNMNSMIRACSNLISLDISCLDTSNVTDMFTMFYECENLVTVDVSNFNTSKVTDMAYMFSACYSLNSLDVSGFDTHNVTDMSGMFEACWELTNLDVSNFNTSKVTNMACMFDGCYSLNSLDVSGFDTHNVTDMTCMFSSCRDLTNLDISGFDTSNVTNMDCMFSNCHSLQTLDTSNFDTSNVTNMGWMFVGCYNLGYLNVSEFDTSNVTDMSLMFSGCSNLVNMDLSNFNIQNVVTIDDMFKECRNLATIKTPKTMAEGQSIELPCAFYDSDDNKVTDITLEHCNKTLTKQGKEYTITYHLDGGINGANNPTTYTQNSDTITLYSPTKEGYTFAGWTCYNDSVSAGDCITGMTEIVTGTKGNLDLYAQWTENVPDEEPEGDENSRTFGGNDGFTWSYDESTATLAVTGEDSGLDMLRSNIPDTIIENAKNIVFENGLARGSLSYLLREFNKVESVKFNNFDTSNVTDMSRMFYECNSLLNLDISSFDTEKVTDMNNIFFRCYNLATIKTPKNMTEGQAIELPHTFYDSEDNKITEITSEHCNKTLTSQGKEYTITYHLDGGINDAKNPTTYTQNSDTITLYSPTKEGYTFAGWTCYNDSVSAGDCITGMTEIVTGTKGNLDLYAQWTENVPDEEPEDDENSGTFGDNGAFSWNYDESTATITITGEDNGLDDLSWAIPYTILTNAKNILFRNGAVRGSLGYLLSQFNKIEKVEFNNFDTSNIRYTDGMFENCSSLTYVDLGCFNTSNVETMHSMFSGCSNLTYVDLSSFDTSNVETMHSMFSGCSNLTYVDLSSFNLRDFTNTYDMFYGCNNLETIKTPQTISEEIITDLPGIFCDSEGNRVSQLTSDHCGTTLTKYTGKIFGNNDGFSWDYDENTKTLTVTGEDSGLNRLRYYISNEILTNVEKIVFQNCVAKGSLECLFSGFNKIETVEFDNFDTSNVTDMSEMFSGCSNLVSIDLSSFDTSNTKYMSEMFSGCSNLVSVDLSSFDIIENIFTNAWDMFDGCDNLETIKTPQKISDNPTIDLPDIFCDSANNTFTQLSAENCGLVLTKKSAGTFGDNNGFNWNYDKNTATLIVTGSDSGLNALRSELSKTALNNVEKIIFRDCNASGSLENLLYNFRTITTVDMSSLNVDNAEDTNNIFFSCINLATIITPQTMSSAKSIKLPGIFCDSEGSRTPLLTSDYCGMTLTKYTGKIFGDNNGFSWDYDESSKTLTVTGEDSGMEYLSSVLPSEVLKNVETLIFQDCIVSGSLKNLLCEMRIDEIEFNNFDTHNVTDMSGMFKNCSLYEIDLSSLDTSNVTDMSEMFYKSGLDYLNVSNFDTSNVTDMSGMFYQNYFGSLDLSSFDTSNVTDMSKMFYGCIDLKVDLSSFNTSNVTDMSSMFEDCERINEDVVSGFDTRNVTNMSRMFYYGEVVRRLDVSSFDTRNVTDMSGMFGNCWNLTSLDVSNFDTSNVTDMSSMFANCEELTSLDVSGFDTSNVTDMSNMFYSCWQLTSLDVSSFDTSNVTDISGFFGNCWNLTSLDVSNFDTSNVTDMSSMFANCEELTSLDVSNFDTRNVTNIKGMFSDCGITYLDINNFNLDNVTDDNDSWLSRHIITLKTPKTMNEGRSIELQHIYCDETGRQVTELTSESCNMILKAIGGAFGDAKGYHWNYDESTETLTVTGEDYRMNEMNIQLPKTIVKCAKNIILQDCIIGDYLGGLFSSFESVENVTFSNCDITNVYEMNRLFAGCSRLVSVDLSCFDTRNVSITEMFRGCNNLITIKTPKIMAETQSIALPYTFCDSDMNKTKKITSEYCNKTLTKYEPKYTISYHLDGGVNDADNPGTYTANSATITLKAATKTGYTFAGWKCVIGGDSVSGGNIVSGGDIINPDSISTDITEIATGTKGNLYLFAQWTPNKYTVAFDGNGATDGKMDSQSGRSYDESFTLTANTYKRAGYIFNGWNTSADGSGRTYRDKDIVKNLTDVDGNTVTLYAKWVPIIYTIKFDKNGATGGKMSNLTNLRYDTPYKLTANAYKRTGYTFAGWNTKANGKGETYKNKASIKNLTDANGKTITLYAQWTPIKYTIKFNGNGATSGKMRSMTTRKYGTNYKLSDNKFKRKGYTFTGWNTKKNGKGKTYKNRAKVKNLISDNGSAVTLYAQWKKETYKITYKLNKGTNNRSNPKKYDITTKTITLKAPTRKGYTFKGWYKDSKFKKPIKKISKGSTGNITLYAKWEKNNHKDLGGQKK